MSEKQVKRSIITPSSKNPSEIVQSTAKCSKVELPGRHSEEREQDTVLNKLCDEANCEDLLSDIDENWSYFESHTEELYTLDLSKWQRCKVLTVERCANQCLLVVLEGKMNKEKAKCYLSYPWNTLEEITPGLIVSVKAGRESEDSGRFVVNSKDGFFVTKPDLLLSATTVVGSLHCRRRGVLQDIFRMVDAENQQMHIGTLAHAIFQRCLTDDSCLSLEDVRRVAGSWLTSSKMVSTLYTYRIKAAEALRILDPYLVEIALFFEKYVYSKNACSESVLDSGKTNEKETLMIHKIIDIEENIWCHHLGIKGKIDATVSVTCRNDGSKISNEHSCQVMPLELKTGRASYSFEHTGQLVLYEMMMNLAGHCVNSGLLLYLREGKCSRMVGDRNVRRDLIMLRNEIAQYIDRWMIPNVSSESRLPLLPVLPEPINNPRACVKCPYNTVCIVMAKKELKQNTPTEGHGLSLITEEASGHLSNLDIDYFIRWTGIIYMEQQEAATDYTIKYLWTKKPEERVKNGWCIAGLNLIAPVRTVDNCCFHTFSIQPELNVLDSEIISNKGSGANQIFTVGDYVICSTNVRIAIAAGYIMSYVGHELVASFERDLSLNYSGELFHLDRSEPYKSGGFNLTNLVMLLGKSDEARRCRRIIINREKPSFADGFLLKSMIPEAKKVLEKLNRDQKLATLKAASTNSYCLIKGLPGTGKTQTIVALIRILSAMGESVLLTSNTHSAVDNVLKRLAQHDELQFIRLGSLERIDPAIRAFSAAALSEHCDTPDKLSDLYNQFKIVAVTCQGTSHPLIAQRMFDYCIVDEATQVFQSSIIRPLLQSKRFLLVGDPEQLPPVINSNEARLLGATESLFHRLDQEGSFYVLPTQYRMNRVLTKLANDFTYDGDLVCGNDIVANATLKLPQLHTLRQMYGVERWLMKTISNQIDLSAVVLDTGYTCNLNHQLYRIRISEEKQRIKMPNYMNIAEVALTVYICGALLHAGVEGTSIGVMAPFRSQVDLIRQHLGKLLQKKRDILRPLAGVQSLSMAAAVLEQPSDDCGIEVNTVDQFQGKDKKLIIYSCTRSVNADTDVKIENKPFDDNGNGILHDKRRLTVAITRAQEKLIVIGDRTSLNTYTPFNTLFKAANKIANVKIVDQKDGFEWNHIIDYLHSLTD